MENSTTPRYDPYDYLMEESPVLYHVVFAFIVFQLIILVVIISGLSRYMVRYWFIYHHVMSSKPRPDDLVPQETLARLLQALGSPRADHAFALVARPSALLPNPQCARCDQMGARCEHATCGRYTYRLPPVGFDLPGGRARDLTHMVAGAGDDWVCSICLSGRDVTPGSSLNSSLSAHPPPTRPAIATHGGPDPAKASTSEEDKDKNLLDGNLEGPDLCNSVCLEMTGNSAKRDSSAEGLETHTMTTEEDMKSACDESCPGHEENLEAPRTPGNADDGRTARRSSMDGWERMVCGLPCGHRLHRECVLQLVSDCVRHRRVFTCPECRSPFSVSLSKR